MSKPELILIGGGGHCVSCIDVIELQNKFEIAGIVDVKEKIGANILNYKVIGCDDDLKSLTKSYNHFLITLGQIGSADKRIYLYNKLISLDAKFSTIISPLAYVSKHAKVGDGTIVLHNAIVNANATIGVNCIVNTKALIEHDCEISDHCHVATGAIINGGVRMGKGTFFGSGAVSKNNITIPENSFIKANSIVK